MTPDRAPILDDVDEPVDTKRTERHNRWIGFGVFAGIWLVFLGSPLAAAATHGDPVERVIGVTATILFAVAYIMWLAFQQRRGGGGWGGNPACVPLRYRVGVLVGLSALALATVPAAGPAALTFLVFIVATAIGSFGGPSVWIAGGAGLLLCFIVYVTDPGSHDTVPGTALGLVLASIAVQASKKLSVRGRQLEAARAQMTELAVAAERERMARDLHDILGHSLTVIAMKSELAGRLVERDTPRDTGLAATEIADIERLARQSLADVRATINGSREVNLATEIVNARTALAAAGIRASLPNALDDVPIERSELFGWVVREAVTNVVRHSAAAHCTVTVGADHVEIVDDGIGLADVGDGDGMGLHGLRERVDKAGGALTLGVGPSGGLRLRVELPPLAHTSAVTAPAAGRPDRRDRAVGDAAVSR